MIMNASTPIGASGLGDVLSRSVQAGKTQGAIDEARAASEGGRADEAADRFEALFATLLVREPRKSLSDGLFDGTGSQTYEGWFDEHLGQTLAETDALGLAGMIKTGLAQTTSTEENPS